MGDTQKSSTILTKLHQIAPQRRRKTPTSKHTFDFLGFTHYWEKSRKGSWVIKRKTASNRIRRTLRSIWQWCHENRHWSLPEQHRIPSSKLHGHYNYYGIRGNYKMLEVVYEQVLYSWKRWLGRRHRDGFISWEKFLDKILQVFPLPLPRVVHLNGVFRNRVAKLCAKRGRACLVSKLSELRNRMKEIFTYGSVGGAVE